MKDAWDAMRYIKEKGIQLPWQCSAGITLTDVAPVDPPIQISHGFVGCLDTLLIRRNEAVVFLSWMSC